VLEVLLGNWFEPEDVVTAVEAVDTGTVIDRERVTYRLRLSTPAGG
jgi:hypothetical protein